MEEKLILEIKIVIRKTLKGKQRNEFEVNKIKVDV